MLNSWSYITQIFGFKPTDIVLGDWTIGVNSAGNLSAERKIEGLSHRQLVEVYHKLRGPEYKNEHYTHVSTYIGFISMTDSNHIVRRMIGNLFDHVPKSAEYWFAGGNVQLAVFNGHWYDANKNDTDVRFDVKDGTITVVVNMKLIPDLVSGLMLTIVRDIKRWRVRKLGRHVKPDYPKYVVEYRPLGIKVVVTGPYYEAKIVELYGFDNISFSFVSGVLSPHLQQFWTLISEMKQNSIFRLTRLRNSSDKALLKRHSDRIIANANKLKV